MRRALTLAVLTLSTSALAQPLTTSFVYQGELRSAGAPITTPHDVRFSLWDAPAAGSQVGPTLCIDNLTPIDGRFSTPLNFGAIFTGQRLYLQIETRSDTGLNCANTSGFSTLAPRQELTITPHAAYSITSGTATSATNATQLNGQAASFYTNAANLSAGTIPDARLASTVARTNITQTFTGATTFSNASNSFTGNGAGLTSLNASSILSGTLADARLSSNVANLAAAQTFTGVKNFNAAPVFNAAGSPFSVAASGVVTNLNADLLDGQHAAAFALTSHSHDAAAITTGVFADARISGAFPRLASTNTFTSLQNILVATNNVLELSSSAISGSWLNLENTSASGRRWNLISTGSGSTEGVGKFLIRDNSSNLTRLAIDSSGRLGVGMTSPGAPLDVQIASGQTLQFRQDSGLVPGINVNTSGANAGVMRLRNAIEVWPSDDATRAGRVDVRNTSGTSTIALNGATGVVTAQGISGEYTGTGSGLAVYGVRTGNNNRGWFGGWNEGGWAESPTGTGFVARTTTGSYALYAERNPGTTPANVNRGWFGGSGEGAWAESDQGNGIVALTRGLNAAAVYCRNDAGGRALFADGVAAVRALEILGGADLAEPFDISGDPLPGMVVAIDPNNPGQLRIAHTPYDTAVAGIISGANGLSPGMVMRDDTSTLANGSHPVAMTGRVWCYVDATHAEIRPGDRLTTSATPGHAMRVLDEARSPGTVIGKAMTPLAKGENGLVLVLVNLQ
ncbi:MAG: hypothetical protein HUU18_08535 [Phycisphaerales bacterium]|nr:hypothetical protein [Phycisphaerales bacterium]